MRTLLLSAIVLAVAASPAAAQRGCVGRNVSSFNQFSFQQVASIVAPVIATNQFAFQTQEIVIPEQRLISTQAIPVQNIVQVQAFNQGFHHSGFNQFSFQSFNQSPRFDRVVVRRNGRVFINGIRRN